MRVLRYTVPPDCDGITVRDYVRRRLGFSARFLTRQKQAANGILRNGEACRSSDALRAGDDLRFCLPEETACYEPVAAPFSVLWETEDFLAADKPPGMPVHPSPGHGRDSLLNAAAYYFGQTGQSLLFRPLYRLDRDTSGLVLLAKHRAAAAARLEKRYFAVCQGTLAGSGMVDAPIGRKPGSKILRECGRGDAAVTHWKALGTEDGHTLLSLRLETGRTHQIRVHLSAIGHPLAGDDLYGGSLQKIGRQALHCGILRVSCPALDAVETVVSGFPPDMLAAFPWLPAIEDEKEETKCQPV